MNKFKWTYIDERGGLHQVGLMHGVQSGNLLIICNSDILLIDFKVFSTKTYSFFIEEELCEIEIERRDNRFHYGFNTDKKVDTPLNRRRRKQEKKHLFQSLAFLGGLLAVILCSAYFLTLSNKPPSGPNFKAILAKYHEFTEARTIDHPTKQDAYSFIVDGKTYTGNAKFTNISPAKLDHGMPIETGDEFIVKYSPKNPAISEIDFNQPTEKQTETYHLRAFDKYQALNPQLDSSYCQCIINVAFEISGLKGLANFYHQDASPTENKRYNSDSYSRLTKGVQFKKMAAEKCFEYR